MKKVCKKFKAVLSLAFALLVMASFMLALPKALKAADEITLTLTIAVWGGRGYAIDRSDDSTADSLSRTVTVPAGVDLYELQTAARLSGHWTSGGTYPARYICHNGGEYMTAAAWHDGYATNTIVTGNTTLLILSLTADEEAMLLDGEFDPWGEMFGRNAQANPGNQLPEISGEDYNFWGSLHARMFFAKNGSFSFDANQLPEGMHYVPHYILQVLANKPGMALSVSYKGETYKLTQGRLAEIGRAHV